MHSGGTHGIRSSKTGTQKYRKRGRLHQSKAAEDRVRRERTGQARLTFSGQHGDADSRIAEFDEGQAARRPILLSYQENILGTDVSMNEVFILL